MDYALAKELKDAGFPQDLIEGHYLEKSGRLGYGPSKRTVYTPTLEELIAACPKIAKKYPQASLTLTWLNKQQRWIAYYELYEGSMWEEGEGATPTEAVARLWLALNKKQPQ